MRRRAPERPPGLEERLWERLEHVRLALGRDWPAGAHTAAQDEYLRIDALALPPERKITMLKVFFERRSPPDVVADEFAAMARLAERYDTPPPVRRLRIVAPD